MGKDVWVWCEQTDNGIAGVSLELLGKASELAARLSCKVCCVLAGSRTQAEELVYYGAHNIFLLEEARDDLYPGEIYPRVLADLARRHEPQIILLGATSLGSEISARTAANLGTGLTAHCIELHINEEGRLAQMVPGTEQNTVIEIVCRQDPQMATARAGVFSRPERDPKRTGEIIAQSLTEDRGRVKVVSYVEEKSPEQPLEDAKIIVAGGWGLHALGGFGPVRELAGVLGAAVGGTRPSVDKEWVPADLMIGQSGKTVHPDLFISLGASGAMHFTTGFMRARVVLAVDQNPKAPIFDVADVGIVGDLREVLPVLIEEMKKVHGSGSPNRGTGIPGLDKGGASG